MQPKFWILSLNVSVAIGLAAIIYIIVDKTSYCRTGTPNPFTAVTEDLNVICIPGYVFEDGSATHELKCNNPPYWDWPAVPKCFKVDEAVGWRCPILPSNNSDLIGEVMFVQSDPQSAIHIDGRVAGLKNSVIQSFEVANVLDSCNLTKDVGPSTTSRTGATIEGDVLRIHDSLTKPMQINETFRFYIRAIGSEHAVHRNRADLFSGVAIFILEQSQDTKAVYSADSIANQ